MRSSRLAKPADYRNSNPIKFLFLVNGNSYHLELIHRIDQRAKTNDRSHAPFHTPPAPSGGRADRRPKTSTATVTGQKPGADRTNGSGEKSERVVQSDTLLQGHSHVSIMHNGETYQLRATRLGKLILTK